MSKESIGEDSVVELNLKELVTKLDFTEETTVASILNQPSLYLKASRYRVEKMRLRMAAETIVSKTQTEVALSTRSNSEIKVTEGYVKEQIDGNKKVVQAKKDYDEARAMEEWSKLVLAAYEQRGSMLKALVQLLGAEAANESGFIRAEMDRLGLGKLKEQVKSKYPHK